MNGWIGVDLDGTLAEYHGWQGDDVIGVPIEAMVARVKALVAAGEDVRIFTARTVHEPIRAWLTLNGLPMNLPITNVKDMECREIWDDRARGVVSNTGQFKDEQLMGSYSLTPRYLSPGSPQHMPALVILVGVIGSGKSTWARERARENSRIKIVNRDALREMLHGRYSYDKDFENMVRRVAQDTTLILLRHGYSVIVDETNLTKAKRANIIDLVRSEFARGEVHIEVVEFPRGEFCLRRRCADPRGVPVERWTRVYHEMMEQFEPVSLDEGMDSLLHVSFGGTTEPEHADHAG